MVSDSHHCSGILTGQIRKKARKVDLHRSTGPMEYFETFMLMTTPYSSVAPYALHINRSGNSNPHHLPQWRYGPPLSLSKQIQLPSGRKEGDITCCFTYRHSKNIHLHFLYYSTFTTFFNTCVTTIISTHLTTLNIRIKLHSDNLF